MKTAEGYAESLRRRSVRLFLRGERVEQPIEHPSAAPSVRTSAERSRFIDGPLDRVTHVFAGRDDLLREKASQG